MVDAFKILRINPRHGHILHIFLVGECGTGAQAGGYGHHPRDVPDAIGEAVIEVDVILAIFWADGDMGQVLDYYIEEHILKAVHHEDGDKRDGYRQGYGRY